MGSRKSNMASKIREERKAQYMARLNNCPTSPRKMRRSAISNFEQKSGERYEEADLFIKEIQVDSGRMLKRIQPAPQGRAYRVRKRSNHVTMILAPASQDVSARLSKSINETTETEA